MSSSRRFTSPRGRKLTGLAKKHPLAGPLIHAPVTIDGWPRLLADRPSRILVADGDPDTVAGTAFVLAGAGYRVTTASTPNETLRALRRESFDLIILGEALGTAPGIDVLRTIRARDDRGRLETPRESITVALTVDGALPTVDDQRHHALVEGADDVLVRPFSARELLLRAGALLRRMARIPAEPPNVFRLGMLEVDFDGHDVTVNDEIVDLTPTEFGVLRILADRVGKLCTRESLNGARSGPGGHLSRRGIDMQISRMRRKLGPAGELIENVRGEGYRLRRVPL